LKPDSLIVDRRMRRWVLGLDACRLTARASS